MRINKFFISGIVLSLLFAFFGTIFPEQSAIVLGNVNQSILNNFQGLYLFFGLFVAIAALIIGILPIGKVKLGEGNPEYSFFSWIALLYSTGMGSGLLLRAVQEPIHYLQNPPVDLVEKKQLALEYTFFHWGITPWAMYSVFGLILACNLYVHKTGSFRESFSEGVKNKMIKTIVPFFVIIITIAGVIVSLGLGAGQFVGGTEQYFNIHLNSNSVLLVGLLIGVLGTLSALTGIQKVIKILADFDMAISLLLLAFVAYFLDFGDFFKNTFSAISEYLVHFVEFSLSIGKYDALDTFTKDWTVFYWAFWLAWVPFTGTFIARISKGRTIREFVIATIITPTIATMVWFSVFANKAFQIADFSGANQFNNVFDSLFVFLNHLPFGGFTNAVVLLLILVTIINSVDSAIFVLGMISDDGNENPSKKHKLLWGIIITISAVGLIALGSDNLLNSVSNLLVILALPFSLLYFYLIIIFFKNLLKPFGDEN